MQQNRSEKANLIENCTPFETMLGLSQHAFLLVFSQAIQKTRASEFGTCQRGEKFILR